jgi:hypothetical protein
MISCRPLPACALAAWLQPAFADGAAHACVAAYLNEQYFHFP